MCSISKVLAERLGLEQMATKRMRYGNDNVVEEPVYFVRISFPESGYNRETIAIGHDGDELEFIIGMNIIRTGTFTVEQKRGGGFSFTFKKKL